MRKQRCRNSAILKNILLFTALAMEIGLSSSSSPAAEGMWLAQDLPRDMLAGTYGLDVASDRVRNLEQATVKFSCGGTGAFISDKGLVITSRDVVSPCLLALSSPQNNLASAGFLAISTPTEVRCPGLQLAAISRIDDISSQVNDAADPAAEVAGQKLARREMARQLEQRCYERSGLRCQVVSDAADRQHLLYRFREYSDIRLVFAPESRLARFGGETTRFEFPRHSLNVALVRVWDGSSSLDAPTYLKAATRGARDGDAVFVAGYPSATRRHLAVSEIEFLRDIALPYTLNHQRVIESRLGAIQSPEISDWVNRTMLRQAARGKEYSVMLEALSDPVRLEALREKERQFRDLARMNGRQSEVDAAYSELEHAQMLHRKLFTSHYVLNTALLDSPSAFLRWSRFLVRLPFERARDEAIRSPDFRNEALANRVQDVLSTEPPYRSMEAALIGSWLEELASVLGYQHPLVVKVMSGRNLEATAAEYAGETLLTQPELRRRLLDGGRAAVDASSDRMIVLARAIEGQARTVEKRVAEGVLAVQGRSYSTLLAVRAAIQPTSDLARLPDLPRLGFGRVTGYEERGVYLPALTRISGLFEAARSQNFEAPFDLPPRWITHRNQLRPAIGLNFAAAFDMSLDAVGAPVVNGNGQLVGIYFDSNRAKLANDFGYIEEPARAICVQLEGVIEALAGVYGASTLAEEIVGRYEAPAK